MRFEELLRNNQDAIVQRWLEDTLATYPERAAEAFRRQRDPFANPVGHSLRVGTQAIFEALLDGADEDRIRAALLEIIRIRAVQEIPPARAVGFVFGLRRAIRDELPEALRHPRWSSDVTLLDARLERVALTAFGIYSECREQVHQLRVDEVKRRVSWVVGKMNARPTNLQSPPTHRSGAGATAGVQQEEWR